jgi:hypothetical protein
MIVFAENFLGFKNIEIDTSKSVFLIIILVFFGQACTTTFQKNSGGGNFEGVIHSFEYSYFKSISGKIYNIKINDIYGQKEISKIIRLSDKSSEICVKIKFSGNVINTPDQLHPQTVIVDEIKFIYQINCKTHSYAGSALSP